MSQVITNAFEQYWQSSLAAEQPVVLDEFILADIPNLDITSPIDPETGLPPESQIVHRQNVDQRGRINNNAVAYTIVMDTTVGDFSFNAMYLRNKANGVIGMIVYKGRETKLKTDQTTGQTGNSLVKSMLMGYDQAAEATLTNVDAGTWQIDYAARLRGMDEDIRQLQADLYGHHTFVGDGFKVVEKDGAYQVTQGVAIVGGLRVELKAPEVIHPGTKPIGVWVDVHRAGSLLSEHQNHVTIITSVADLTDHVDSNGYQHFVAKLGSVQADSTVVDSRGITRDGETSFPESLSLLEQADTMLAITSWEALRRSYAEAGYSLRDRPESFGKGGTLTFASDVLLDEGSGKAYSSAGPYPRTVEKGTDPSSGGFTDRSKERLREMLASTGGAAMIGSQSGPLSEVLYSIKRVSPIEKRFAGGADPTGVADSTDALEACIAYCSPFEWKGSISATKAAMGAVVAAMSGFGKFRITRPLKVNPYLVIATDHVGGFFGQNGGFQIIADFDDKNGFALDAAPYNESGARELGRLASRTDWDDGHYTGCPGFSMFGVDVVVKPGRNIRGTLNRCMMQQSHIHRCSLIGGNISIQNSTSWGGSLRDNHMIARAIPLLNGNDMTVDDQQNNYLTVSGSKPTTAEFDYPNYPEPSLVGKTCCVYNSYGHPMHKNNIWEGGQIGAMCTNAASMHLDDNYVEGATFEYILAAHTVAVKLSLSWVIAPNAKLIHARAASVELEVNHAAYLKVSTAAIANADSYSVINLKGLKTRGLGWYLLKMPYLALANYEDAIVDGVRSIFVSPNGNDANSGLHVDTPVQTLQTAISRVHKSAINRIYVTGRVATNYMYPNGENVSNTTISAKHLEIVANGDTPTIVVGQSWDEVHSIPSNIDRVTIEGVAIELPPAAGSRKIFIPGDGSKNVKLTSVAVQSGSSVALIGPAYGRSCLTTLECRDSSLPCVLQDHYGTASGWAWIDVAVNTSVAGGSVGSVTSKKISSALYP
ncbi:phage tail protein [Aeromonas caviae]|uniref:phage tail-collar fiber domain-containing protein n=1 Tax=Aeromonas caviae TaxID=648 RepID=UPI0029D77C0A|nr:phage tail protein [Aeromonas caviae]MDX7728048.1 phage tail protein [Aeromonas caviae]